MTAPTLLNRTPPGPLPAPGLGVWNLYFLAKFALAWKELTGFHPLENLAFALVLLLPLPSPAWRRARLAVAIPFGIALLYYDSWLPSFSRVLSQASLISNFSLSYLIELGGRFVSAPVVALLIIVAAAYLILERWLRFSVLVTGALLALVLGGSPFGPSAATDPVRAGGAAAGAAGNVPEAALREFFAREAGRSVTMPRPAAGDAPVVAVVHALESLFAELKLPRRLRDVGVTHESLTELAAISFDDWYLQSNPRPLKDAKEVQQVLEEAW